MSKFNGLGMGLATLSRLSDAVSRTITPENFTGEKGGACRATEGPGAGPATDLGLGWKISPLVRLQPGQVLTMADIEGPGAVQSMWMTITGNWRHSILRIYWDDQPNPSVECPVGHFFCAGWNRYAQVNALPINVNPGKGFCCYFEMPFRKRCRITLESLHKEVVTVYYQINYTLTEVPDDCAYFHAQFRRENPVQYGKTYTLLDGVEGQGQYVGTYMAISPHGGHWWGEGEVKFYIDGDEQFPTVTSTGLEDYFCGAYDFVLDGKYTIHSGPYSGLPQVVVPDGIYQCETMLGLYRFHVRDPIRFKKDLRIEVQDLGWSTDHLRYLPRQDDFSSVAYWYQTLPTKPFPPLPDWHRINVAMYP